MVLHLAEQLEIPLADRNGLLVAAGYAPAFATHVLDDAAMDIARETVNLVLAGHEPYPAVAVDRHWNLLASNRAIGPMLEGIPSALLQAPVNVFRLTLHPGGLAPRIANYTEWRAHILDRVHRQAAITGDPALSELLDQLWSFPAPACVENDQADLEQGRPEIATSLRLRTEHGLMSFIYTTTVFGSAAEVTLSGLTIESFFPSDRETATILRRLGDSMSTVRLHETNG
jgi:hypothetical protein